MSNSKNIYDMSWEEVYSKGSLSKEEFDKLKAELDNSPLHDAAWDAITKQNTDATKFFVKLHYLLVARMNYLEMYLKSVQGQCTKQDEIIKHAERKLGNGFWQNNSIDDEYNNPLFRGYGS